MSIIVKRGDLRSASKSFPELVGKYRARIEWVLESAFEQTVSQPIECFDESTKQAANEYLLLLVKTYLPVYLPKLHEAGSGAVDQVARQVFATRDEASDLFAFCHVYGLDPIQSQVRLVDSRVNYVQASTYYNFKGTIIECYQGFSVYTKINKRREFTVYLPDRELGRATFDIRRALTERRREVKL